MTRYVTLPGSAGTELIDRDGYVWDADPKHRDRPVRQDAALAAALFGANDRWHRGERNPAARLTDDQAAEVRRIYALPHRGAGWLPQAELAEMFGVSQATISRIVSGKAY